ncbi:MAG: chromosomal replication initiator protein DnaA [Desulfovibrionaceae bacterium]
MDAHWSTILLKLQNSLDSGVFKVWIAPLHGRVEGSCVDVYAPNRFVADWVRSRLSHALVEAASAVLAVPASQVTLRISHATPPANTVAVGAEKPLAPTAPVVALPLGSSMGIQRRHRDALPVPDFPLLQGTTASHTVSSRPALSWRYRFDDFVVGPTNEVAVAAARDVCKHTSPIETLFLSAESGLGKTHLVQAMGQAITKEKGQCHIAYLTAEEFTSRFVAALRARDMDSFKSRLREVDVLMLEDVHFLQGKEKIQDEALSTIKSLQARGSRVILTSSFSPRELRNVDSQLVSHFCSGFLSHIGKPTIDMRRSILERKARLHQVILPGDVTDLLAERISADVRQLESCLNNLIFKARHLNRQISFDMALEIVAQYASVDPSLDVETIIRLVCESYGLKVNQISSRSRKQECVLARNTIYYLARKHTDLSLQDIGGKFNRRHSTVIKGITNLEREMQRESSVGRQVQSTVNLIERTAGISV